MQNLRISFQVSGRVPSHETIALRAQCCRDTLHEVIKAFETTETSAAIEQQAVRG
ncbi:hypothetical protein [Acidocella sp.]|uniref:hypothetical protein n=1 Tax=Acidocella sp. TaxID=50710 RepID=UPI002F3FE4D7